jgi:alkylation response protein AidB-like acyl-CoA dehydrogenase
MTVTNQTAPGPETLESFRRRARQFIHTHLTPADPDRPHTLSFADARALQAVIYDAGFAGLAVPSDYGGAGLTPQHQGVWAEEVQGFTIPAPLFVSIGILGSTLLEHGSETLKTRHLPKILRGDEVWIQLLSEPSGGSDMAGVTTRATRDGETWVVNGSKMWTSNAPACDYGMCLARTDWDAPKHKGLSMFAVPLTDPKVTITPIVNIQGRTHNFQEFFDDVTLPLDHLIGDENQGWSVAHTLLFHEHNATAGVGFGLGLGGGHVRGGTTSVGHGVEDLVRYAQPSASIGNQAVRQLVAEAYIAQRAATHAGERISAGTRTGAYQGDWGSLLKLGLALDTLRRAEIGLAVAGADGVIWTGEPESEEASAGFAWLGARAISIAAGTNEMQRNIVSERLLGMPREPSADRDVPYNEVIRRRDRG